MQTTYFASSREIPDCRKAIGSKYILNAVLPLKNHLLTYRNCVNAKFTPAFRLSSEYRGESHMARLLTLEGFNCTFNSSTKYYICTVCPQGTYSNWENECVICPKGKKLSTVRRCYTHVFLSVSS